MFQRWGAPGSHFYFFSPFEVIDYDSKDAWEDGEIRAKLEAAGRPVGGNDMMITAQARRRGLVLITHNTREFSRVAGIRVEDWAGG